MSKNLINITEKDGQQLVSARELHEFLEVGRDFTTWIKGRINKYGFVENIDFTVVWNDTKTGDVVDYNGNSNSMVKLGYECDYVITIDMAKELSMVQNNEKGKEARRYFIECEKKLKQQPVQPQLPKDYLSALKALVASEEEKQALAERNIELLDANNVQKEIIEELQPKADYTDIVLNSPELVSVTQISKDYGMSAIAFNRMLKNLNVQYKRGGQWFLKAEYQDLGWTQSCTYVLDDGETTHNTTKWTQKGRLGLYNFLKEMDIVPLIEKSDIE